MFNGTEMLKIFFYIWSLCLPTILKAQVDFERSNDAILGLLEFTEEAQKWRSDFRSKTNQIKLYMQQHDSKIQSGQYLNMQELAEYYVYKIHHPLNEIVEGKENFLLFDDFFEIQTQVPTNVTMAYRKQKLKYIMMREDRSRIKFKTVKVKKYSVNPFDEKGQLLMRSFKLQLAAKLLLVDNYMLALSGILDDTYLRRTLLWDLEVEHVDVKNTLWNTWKSFYHDYQNPRDLYQAHDIIAHVKHLESLTPFVHGKDKYFDALDELIDRSIIWKLAAERKDSFNFFKETSARMALMNARQRDQVGEIAEDVLYSGSKIFGNIAGSFYIGKGKLYNMTDDELDEMSKNARALDVMFDKTGFRLTDSFIPGHFTHAAVWSGTEEELKDLGVWDELPALYRRAQRNYNYKGPDFQTAIRSNHNIIEALRPGVQINTLRHFIDIDDIAFLRPKTCESEKSEFGTDGNPKCLTKAMKKRNLIEAFKQIGKEYDFNFDVNTRDRIVCSELVYRTFLDTNFDTEKTMGRHTIISDQIIPRADDPEDLMYPVLLIINGVRITDSVDEMQAVLKILKDENYVEFERRTGISSKY